LNPISAVVCSMTHEKRGSEKWIDAHYDPVSALHSFSHCIVFSDIHADADFKLVVADFGSGVDNIKLKVFKGVNFSALL